MLLFKFGNMLFGCCHSEYSMVCPNHAVLLLRFLLKIRSVRILDRITCSGASAGLVSACYIALVNLSHLGCS